MVLCLSLAKNIIRYYDVYEGEEKYWITIPMKWRVELSFNNSKIVTRLLSDTSKTAKN